MVNFREYLRKKLKEKGLSLREFAREVNIDVGFVSKILKGLRSPPQEEKVIKKMAKVLGVDEDYLIFLSGKIPKEYMEFFSLPRNVESIKRIVFHRRGSASFKKVRKKEKRLVKEIPDEIL